MSSSIHIIPSAEINAIRWDNCVTDNGGLIYSTYHYLTTMADNWHGIIIDDYNAVMALPWRKKWGIKYIYTPPFMQQLGLIGDVPDINNVVSQLNKFCSYCTYNLNFNNQSLINLIHYTEHTNFVLSLSESASELLSNYSKSLTRNLQKARTNGVTVAEGNYTDTVDWYKQYQGNKMTHVSDTDYVHLKKLLARLSENNQLICKNALNKNGNIIATIVCIKDQKRIYNLLPSSSEEGKDLSAMHVLLNQIITEYAGSNLLFDFEGSNIKGLQRFYQQYGSINQPYYRIHQNNLPIPIKWLKK